MNKYAITPLMTSLILISCDTSTEEGKPTDEAPVLEERKSESNNSADVKGDVTPDSEDNAVVEENLAQGENDELLIRVDRLTNDDLVYRSWNKPKTAEDVPDLELTNGTIDERRADLEYACMFSFSDGERKYIVERDWTEVGLFLRLMQNGEKKLYSKLNDITIDPSEKESYSKSDLIGRWWTPHFAVRKVEFFSNDRFKFNDGNDAISEGSFTFSDRKVTLSFDSGEKDIVMELGGGNNDYSYTLVGDGENFVNER